MLSPLISGLTSASATQTAGTAAYVSREATAPVTATLLSFTQTDATSPAVDLCLSVQSDETSVTRGQTAQWNVSVWSKGGNVGGVTLSLAASPAGQKPVFSFGCPRNGTGTCAFTTVDSDPRQLQARVPVAKTAAFKSVSLTVTGSGKNVSVRPTASVPITVTAPGKSASPSKSATGSGPGSASASAPGAGTAVPRPTGVTSSLPVGGLPFLNGGGSTLSPGGNASSLFPTLNPSAGVLPEAAGRGGDARTRPVAQTLPADASVMGAQYAGLGALALAFVLSVTRLSIRRRQAAKPKTDS